MKTTLFRPNVSVFAAFIVGSLLMSSGCDQANDLIKEAKESVSNATEDSAAPESTTPTTPTSAPVPTPAEPTPPSPAEVLANFKKLKPHDITDGALQSLAASPEAAAQVTELELSNWDSLTGGGLQTLGALTNLTKLKLSNGKIDSGGLVNLSEAKSLKDLDVSATMVDNKVVSALESIAELETLSLRGTRVTPDVGASLSRLRRLKSIDLSNTSADDTTVAAIAALPLENVNLAKTRITNVSVQALLKVPSLTELHVALTQVNGAAFSGISRSKVKVLGVSGTPFGIEGFAALKGSRSLEEIHAHSAGLVQHKAANVFKTMPKLRFVTFPRILSLTQRYTCSLRDIVHLKNCISANTRESQTTDLSRL